MSVEWSRRDTTEAAVFPPNVIPDGAEGEEATVGWAFGFFHDGEGLIVEGFESREMIAKWLEATAENIRQGRYEGSYEEPEQEEDDDDEG